VKCAAALAKRVKRFGFVGMAQAPGGARIVLRRG